MDLHDTQLVVRETAESHRVRRYDAREEKVWRVREVVAEELQIENRNPLLERQPSRRTEIGIHPASQETGKWKDRGSVSSVTTVIL
eukprot:scaffold836_cov135-Skeletonema_marinoi.AAC.13